MPNHCSQDLFIYGPEDSLKVFMEFAKEGDNTLSANKFIPYPEEYRLMDEAAAIARKNKDWSVKDGFNSGGYEWCIENWGTKWGIYNADLTNQKFAGKRSRLNYIFNSAWSPAIPVIKAMSERYPELLFKLKYYESGAGYKGVYEVQDGNVIKDEESKYRGMRGG